MTANVTLRRFRADARRAIQDEQLQGAFDRATHKFRTDRNRALAAVPDVEHLRDRLKAVRAATLARLADHLLDFERHAKQAGAHVHWARTPQAANAIAIDIARRHGVELAVKSKSMASEEIHLNRALLAAGIDPVETDLGEWIIQQFGEPPSHIIAPAIHKTRQQVADLFSRMVGRDLPPDDVALLTAEARRILREQFLAAGMGISGVNLAVAETGSIVLVTNEGNGRMVTGAPKVHVAIMGLEKIVPDWDGAAMWLSLLARSAAGQPMSIYTSVLTGPKRAGDEDGPEELHIILLDHNRSALLGTPYEEVLQCIRCGACLNVCPVYAEAGGHAYGSPYSGPIGAVITPLLFGLEQYKALPHASSLCGACLDVCPVRIDLPRMLLALREAEVDQGLVPGWEQMGERAVAYGFAQADWFGRVAEVARLLQTPLAGDGHVKLPPALNPVQERRLPALAPRSFRKMWEDGEL